MNFSSPESALRQLQKSTPSAILYDRADHSTESHLAHFLNVLPSSQNAETQFGLLGLRELITL